MMMPCARQCQHGPWRDQLCDVLPSTYHAYVFIGFICASLMGGNEGISTNMAFWRPANAVAFGEIRIAVAYYGRGARLTEMCGIFEKMVGNMYDTCQEHITDEVDDLLERVSFK